MAVETHEDLLRRAEALRPEEQLYLLEGLAMLLRRTMAPEHRRSILELEGLGQHVWRDEQTGELMDAQEYVNRERASWRG